MGKYKDKNGQSRLHFEGDTDGVIDAGMGLFAATAPAIKNINMNSDERMSDKGAVTHKVNTGANMMSMGAAGAKAGAMFGETGKIVGGIAGAVGGLGLSILDANKQPTIGEQVQKRNKFNVEQMTKSIASNDTFAQPMQAAADGLSDVANTKNIEVEKDEIVLRKVGKAFLKVADFKNGKPHSMGGEPYTASEGDIIFPGKKRYAVDQALRTRDWKRLESMRVMLPPDTPAMEKKDGVGKIEPRKDGITTTTERPITMAEAERDEKTSIFTTESLMDLGFAKDSSTSQYPALDLGKYKDVGYFDVQTDDRGEYSLINTQKNPANPALYKEQLDQVQKLNPNAIFKRNNSSGYKNYEDGTSGIQTGNSKEPRWNKFLEQPGVKEKVEAIAKKYKFTVDELMEVMDYETGHTLNPGAKAGNSSAVGLIQFISSTAKDLGTTTEALSKMDSLAQLEYVDKYFEKNHKEGSHPYDTVVAPAFAGKPDDAIIYPAGSKEAEKNPSWQDENGNVTKASARQVLGTTPKADKQGVGTVLKDTGNPDFSYKDVLPKIPAIKTKAREEYEKELKEGKLPYWNSQTAKGKKVRNYKDVRGSVAHANAMATAPAMNNWLGRQVTDIVTGLNVPERLTNAFGKEKDKVELDEIGFENNRQGKLLEEELSNFLNSTMGTRGVGNLVLSAADGFNAYRDAILTGQTPAASLPNSIGNLMSWYKPEEVEKILNDLTGTDRLSPWAEHIVRDAYNNPENWYSKDTETGFKADIATIIANPKGLYNLGKTGVKLVKGSVKGAVKAPQALLKLMTKENLKKAPGLAKKAYKTIKESFEDGSLLFKDGETIEDLAKLEDAAISSKIPVDAETSLFLKGLKNTKEFVGSLPDKMRKAVTGNSFKEIREFQKTAENITGKSTSELAKMNKGDVLKLYNEARATKIDAITDATKSKEAAWTKYKDLKKSFDELLKEEKIVKAGKATPVEVGRIEGQIAERTKDLKAVQDDLAQIAATEKQAYSEINRLEAFMDDDLYKDKWRVVKQLNDGVNNQMKVLDESDELVKMFKADQDLISSNVKALNSDLGEARKANILKIRNTGLDAQEAKTAAQRESQLAGKNGPAQKDLAALEEKFKGLPSVWNAIKKDAKLVDQLFLGAKTATQVALSLEHSLRDAPDEKLKAEIDKIKEDPTIIPEDSATRDPWTPAMPDGTAQGVAEPKEEGLTVPTDAQYEKDMKPRLGGETEKEKGPGILSKIGGTLESLAQYAPAIYNIAKGLEKPEKVQRRFVTPQTKEYHNMSQTQLNLIDDAFNAQIGNARNMSGGLMSNFRSNSEGAWADKISRTAQVNNFEAGRADEIASGNIDIRNQAEQINTQTNQQADQMDMQSKAATNSFLAQGIQDVSNIAGMRAKDKSAEKNQQMILGMMNTRNFGYTPTSGIQLNRSTVTPTTTPKADVPMTKQVAIGEKPKGILDLEDITKGI